MRRTVLLLGLAAPLSAGAAPLPFTGVNLAGGEFGKAVRGTPLVYGKHFIYPNQAEIEYFTGQGMNVFRYPFHWEVLQPELGKPLDATEVARFRESVERATRRGCVVILDPHNYARHYGRLIGGPEVSQEDFCDFWRRLAHEFKGNPHTWFGLVNEPHGISAKEWFAVAAAAVRAIRDTGAKNLILVPGTAWSGAHSWTGTWYGGSNA
ncbi:MAG: cellulase family glycosylhydrolase, partial [Armatimonadota bacterium]|nr:cellulase family glycosylhydrolase [Armatimonadota bacterium]